MKVPNSGQMNLYLPKAKTIGRYRGRKEKKKTICKLCGRKAGLSAWLSQKKHPNTI